MSLSILGPNPYFWQWDVGQKLEVRDAECGEVHYCNGTEDCALVVAIRKNADGSRIADVPNILLQTAKQIQAYLYRRHEDGAETVTRYTFQVMPRNRPEDYVYTETEVLSYHSLAKRIDNLEGEGLSKAVADYLEENPIESGATEEEAAQIKANKESIEKLDTDKLDASKLPEAVNTALAQAKSSGEFNGKDGVDGKDGKDGQDGYTPVKGKDYFDGQDGEKGDKGDPGEPGYTPQKGVDYFDGQPGKDGTDGQPGKDGSNGKDGVSPTVTVSKSGKVTTVKITDANGTKTATINDGTDGKDGSDGQNGKDGQNGSNGVDGNGIKSAVLNADYTLTLTFDDGTSYTTPSIRGAAGKDGADGKDGQDGAKGDKGDQGIQGIQGEPGTPGEKGDKGDKGDQGPKGDKGDPGDDYVLTDADKQEIAEIAGMKAPDYVVSEAERVAKKVLSKLTPYTLVGIHTSDMHMVYSDEDYLDYVPTSLLHMAQGVREVRKLVKEDYCQDHGDNSWGEGTVDDGRAEIYGCNRLLDYAFSDSPRKNKTPGNHDPQTYNVEANNGEYIKENEIFAMFGAWGKGATYPSNNRERGYYYTDFSDHKIRSIHLNTSDIKGRVFSTDKAAEYMSGAQMQWLAETIDLSAKEDAAEWEIMFTSHHPLDWGAIIPVTNILRAYEVGGGCNFNHDGETIAYDYSGKNTAKLIGQFHGHLHNFKVDHIHYLDSSGNPQPLSVQRFCIPNACYLRDNEYGRNGAIENNGIEFGEETTYYKQGKANTKDDTAFNVVLICKDTGVVRLINYGKAPETDEGEVIDREITYKEVVPEVTYKNWIKESVEADGTPYNGGLGYKTGHRLSSSSGGESTSGTGVADYEITGFIPIEKGNDLYFYNMEIDSKYSTFCGMALYKADKSFITFNTVADMINVYGANADGTNITHLKCSHDNFANAGWIRFCGYEINSDSIITKNETIPQ